MIGQKNNIQSFIQLISRRFNVGRFYINETVVFNEIRIFRQSDGVVAYDMKDYLDGIQYLDISRTRRKEQSFKRSEAERKQYLQLAGSLNWIGHGVLPQEAFAASRLQQLIGNLSVFYLETANKVL